ncbi:hypothetical protein BUALT_Bualt14G0044700 [Buddleja alternifolia]|uniref:Phytocyanin domain-containing protein n=1 Tax=Buddleja alternifolia TaxID=168488 RepID=A0AAV6WRY9_9LAMI|nr:hypothetical protein BUALT_Bualt14G0044700 [Buddleja alternifolia]
MAIESRFLPTTTERTCDKELDGDCCGTERVALIESPDGSASGKNKVATGASSEGWKKLASDVFKYSHPFHIVMEVTSQDFESCNSSSPILTYTTGHDSVKLTSSGHHYYICGTRGHCEAGQKVHIIVRGHDDSSGPSVSPRDHNRASKSNLSFMWLFPTMLGMSLLVAFTF